MQIGVDLGGTKIEAVALSDNGKTLVRQRIATPRQDYGATIRAIAGLIHNVENELKERCSVGIGIPGAFSAATGLVKNSNSTWLLGKPLDRDLAKQLGRPLRITNDANCLTVSEATNGAAAGMRVVFGVIIGTGVGGGIAINGRPHIGRNAIAGEWGHTSLPWPQPGEQPGPSCYCGKQGCIETFLSGPGLARDYEGTTGITATAAEIASRAAAGEQTAIQALERYEERLARALAPMINILDPDVIVLGGGVSNIERLYQNVPRLLPQFVFSDHLTTELVKAAHGDSSGVFGAAQLWRPDELADATRELV
ncbi:ROK family protein [Pelagibius litoralis]|uniref:ROK family protein n=1 Tax=Pelagibius litoralis TaxID=374515 RepID=A0A967EZD2_9PROT|nr:ROK family protein [Pelagibius litoralis]NIA70263.1 ROK family protein [Pelagibius litoralis]